MQTKTLDVIDKALLEKKVKHMYRNVALFPHEPYHFEMGRSLALKLGYSRSELSNIPRESVDSFAGVGYHFGLADIQPGDRVLDLGSGSGIDLFIAANKVGPSGLVTGIDMTEEQLEKSRILAADAGFSNVTFMKGYIEDLPFGDDEFDVVISNGVINLSPSKAKVFREIYRVLKPGGKMAVSDIVTELMMPENITCNPTLWAACIGGAMQQDEFFDLMEAAGLGKFQVIHNVNYGFISKSAQGASKAYGVKSFTMRGDKDADYKIMGSWKRA